LAFHEKNGTGWIGGGVLNSVESFEGPFGKGTEETIGAQLTDYAIFDQFKSVR
jgi:hypothetical protein